jgi:ribosomal protein S18 acetylase RimI-like enzyme
MDMIITPASEPDDELVSALERLIPQLTQHPAPDRAELGRLLASESSTLLIARQTDERSPIAGIATLIVYRVPTGIRARIEDVIVDEAARGQGLGEGLIRRALELAVEAGAESVGLSSNPARTAANRLYMKMGFQKWDSNHYRYWVKK